MTCVADELTGTEYVTVIFVVMLEDTVTVMTVVPLETGALECGPEMDAGYVHVAGTVTVVGTVTVTVFSVQTLELGRCVVPVLKLVVMYELTVRDVEKYDLVPLVVTRELVGMNVVTVEVIG